MREFLTTAQVAERFKVAPSTVIRWAETNKLPYFKTPGGTYRFWTDDVESFFANGAAESA